MKQRSFQLNANDHGAMISVVRGSLLLLKICYVYTKTEEKFVKTSTDSYRIKIIYSFQTLFIQHCFCNFFHEHNILIVAVLVN